MYARRIEVPPTQDSFNKKHKAEIKGLGFRASGLVVTFNSTRSQERETASEFEVFQAIFGAEPSHSILLAIEVITFLAGAVTTTPTSFAVAIIVNTETSAISTAAVAIAFLNVVTIKCNKNST